jgi:hypothetical protein
MISKLGLLLSNKARNLEINVRNSCSFDKKNIVMKLLEVCGLNVNCLHEADSF